MNRALRLLWVSLLALALPLQGLAGARMSACGPAHPHEVAQAVHAHEALAHEADDKGAHARHGDVAFAHGTHDTHDASGSAPAPQARHAHADAAAVQDTAADDAAADDTSSRTTGQKCSVCASCCTASAGLPTNALVAETGALADSLVDHESAAPAAFLTGGLERPPRAFLA